MPQKAFLREFRPDQAKKQARICPLLDVLGVRRLVAPGNSAPWSQIRTQGDPRRPRVDLAPVAEAIPMVLKYRSIRYLIGGPAPTDKTHHDIFSAGESLRLLTNLSRSCSEAPR